MEFLPRHVPLEFIDLQQVTTIIGDVGGAMLVEGGFGNFACQVAIQYIIAIMLIWLHNLMILAA